MKTLIFVVTFMSFAQIVEAGYGFGSCPSFTNQKNVDINRYTGLWYEYQRDWTTTFEVFSSCVTATYTSRSDGLITVRNKAAYVPFAFLSTAGVEGRAKCYPADGQCYVTFNADADMNTGSPEYKIIDTDYDNYAIVRVCEEMWWGGYQETVWILTRAQTIDNTMYDQITKKMEEKIPDYANWFWRHFTWQGDFICAGAYPS